MCPSASAELAFGSSVIGTSACCSRNAGEIVIVAEGTSAIAASASTSTSKPMTAVRSQAGIGRGCSRGGRTADLRPPGRAGGWKEAIAAVFHVSSDMRVVERKIGMPNSAACSRTTGSRVTSPSSQPWRAAWRRIKTRSNRLRRTRARSGHTSTTRGACAQASLSLTEARSSCGSSWTIWTFIAAPSVVPWSSAVSRVGPHPRPTRARACGSAGSILAAGLRQHRFASAAAADHLGDFLDQVAGLPAAGDQILRERGDDHRLPVARRRQARSRCSDGARGIDRPATGAYRHRLRGEAPSGRECRR